LSEQNGGLNQAFVDYYRCPSSFAPFVALKGNGNGDLRANSGRSSQAVLDGLSPLGSLFPTEGLPPLWDEVRVESNQCFLPFDPGAVAEYLRFEHYAKAPESSLSKKLVHQAYYWMRPLLSVSVRRHLQRTSLRNWKDKPFPKWPVDRTVDQMFERLMGLATQSCKETRIPFVWFWPKKAASCAIMTHDVETLAGLNFVPELMSINESFNILSSFQLIPNARYTVSDAILSSISKRGFEVNVHDLKHDGHLFDDHEQFRRSAEKINDFAVRSGALYRNLDWYDAFQFSYDMSVPNVGHLDPQPGGCCTVFPYFVGNILEIPVTTTQDYSLFHILETYTMDLWHEQTASILGQHGLMSFIVHPDYLNTRPARNAYTALLQHLAKLRDDRNVWIALPGQVNRWWRQRANMQLVNRDNQWHIEGAGAEDAIVAYASLDHGKINYSFE
jgi:hypothetical protein